MKSALLVCLSGLLLAAGCAGSSPSVSQWEFTGGPYAQNVSAVTGRPGQGDSLLAGLTNGEIFSSPNSGKSWTRIATLYPRGSVTSFVCDPESHQRIFATAESGVFLSSTGGRTWQSLTIEPGAAGPIGSRTLAIDPWRTNVIYVGLNGKGIYKSTDGGSSWVSLAGGALSRLPMSEPLEIKVDVTRPDVVYAAVAEMGLLRSTDAGATWTSLGGELSTTAADVTQFVLKEKASQVIVYGTSSGNMFKSTDGGSSWSPTRNGLEVDGVLSLIQSPSDPDLLVAGTANGILVSTDFGTSWTSPRGGLPAIPTSLGTSMSGSTLYAFGAGIGLQQSSDDGTTWIRADTRLGGSTVSVVSTGYATERTFAAVRNSLLYYSTDSGMWVPASTGLSGSAITSISFDEENPQIIFVTTNAGAFRSTDGGTSWHIATRGLRMVPDFLDSHPWIKTRVFASGDQGLFVSTDKGSTWSQARPAGSRFRARSLTFMPTNAGIILGASPNAGVISTKNGGILWESSRYGIPTTADIVAVTMDDKDPSVYYAWTSSGGGYRTTNKGVEWNRYDPPWKSTDTVRIAFDRYKPSSVVALVNGRDIYYSSTGGGTWVPLLERDIQAEVVSVYYSGRTTMFYAGTRDKGVYRISIGKALRETFGE